MFQTVTNNSAAELDILTHLGKILSLRGKHQKACGYFDQVLKHCGTTDSGSDGNALRCVEIHLLYSNCMYHLGDYISSQDGASAMWHSQEALRILDNIPGRNIWISEFYLPNTPHQCHRGFPIIFIKFQ